MLARFSFLLCLSCFVGNLFAYYTQDEKNLAMLIDEGFFHYDMESNTLSHREYSHRYSVNFGKYQVNYSGIGAVVKVGNNLQMTCHSKEDNTYKMVSVTISGEVDIDNALKCLNEKAFSLSNDRPKNKNLIVDLILKRLRLQQDKLAKLNEQFAQEEKIPEAIQDQISSLENECAKLMKELGKNS